MFRRNNNKYFALGVTLLMVIVLSVLFYVIVTHLDTVYNEIKWFFSILSSVIYGIAFAYLMNPIMMRTERGVKKLFAKSNLTERGLRRLGRTVGVSVAVIVFLSIIYGLGAMVLPQLGESIQNTFTAENLASAYDKATKWIYSMVEGTRLEEWFRANDPIKQLQDWVLQRLDFASYASSIFSSVFGVAKTVFNMIIGVVVAVYLLVSKETFLSQIKKLIVAAFKPRRADRIFEIARLTNKSFGGFIVGKIIDSLIIGLLSYIGMSIIGLPFPLIASVFVGITNIIPFFGPLIGIVLGGILIVLESPIDALYYVIFEFALQQVDGNIIGPKILGGKLGISDFWILASITLFGGLFGFGGMIIGVPVFTVIHTLVSQAVNNSLRKKNLPLRTDLYYTIQTVEDLEAHEREFGEATVFQSGDTFDTEYDPEEEIEYDDTDT